MIKYAKLYRNYFRLGIIAAALSYIPLSNAGYAQLAPPVGWSPIGVGGSAGTFNYGSAANGSRLIGNTVRTNASLNVGGRAISVPAAMRFSSNAPKFLAGRVGAALATGGSAALTGGLSVAAALLLPVAIEWWQQTDFEWDGNKWLQKKKVLNGYWRDTWGYGEYSTADAACNVRLTGVHAVLVEGNPNLAFCYYSSGGVGGSVTRVGEEVIEVKVVPYDPLVRESLENTPLPEKLPGIIPLDYPVDLPVINPSPAMQPQPLFVPTGNPVPNPNYNPQAAPGPENMPYLQPGIRITPAPVPGSPWQVDIQPVNRPVIDATPKPDPITDAEPKPGDKPGEKEDKVLCDVYPDVLACAKPDLDTPSGEIPKSEKSVELSDSDLFGGGSCPADSYTTIKGQSLKVWNWQQSCSYIVQYLRPVILVLGAFAALMIVSGGTKE